MKANYKWLVVAMLWFASSDGLFHDATFNSEWQNLERIADCHNCEE